MAELPAWLKVRNKTSAKDFSMLQTNSSHNDPMLCIKTEAPHLPFFCNMENRFRNKFNVYLKLRAGTDEQYMNMIGSCKR